MELIDLAKQAMDSWQLGQTSARFESAGNDPGTVSSGAGDYGGASYGTYQFSSKMGGAAEYIASSRYGSRFADLEPGTPEFTAKWKEIAATDPDGFARDQHDFTQSRYYDMQMQRLRDAGLDLSNRGAAVQDALWSTSVQYQDLTLPVFQAGLKQAYGEHYDLAALTDEQIVRAAQDYKIDHIQSHFRSSPDLWPGLRDRVVSEKDELVQLARYEAIDRQPEAYLGKDYQQAFEQPGPQQRAGHAHGRPMTDGVLAPGESGPEVEVLQRKLIQAGYTGRNGRPLSTDEHYGPNTEHAVREFQKANGLEINGKASNSTRQALDTAIRQQGYSNATSSAPKTSSPAPTTTPAREQHVHDRNLASGERIRVIEPYGSADNKVNRTIPHGTSGEDAYRDLQIHHPNTNRKAVSKSDPSLADRPSQMVEGELETVRSSGDRNGIPLVHKDLILTDREGLRSIMIPNPVAGYVEVKTDAWNSVSIWSHPAGHPDRELLGQVLHGERGSSPYRTGDYVEYGAPLIRQSNAGTGAVHTHIELEPDQFRKYLGDMLNDRLTLDRNAPTPGATARGAMADGMLTRTERGDEVKAMQEKLAALGHLGKDGKPLASTGYFGDDTFAAVQDFQRANGLKVDGRAGSRTLAAIDAALALQAKAGPSMRDAANPDNPRYEQALGKLKEMEGQRAQAGLQPIFTDQEQIERAAGQLVLASKAAGMDRIDSVMARLDGTSVFAVQGQCNDPAARRAGVECSQAVLLPLEVSSRQVEQLGAQAQSNPPQPHEQEPGRALGL